MPASAYYVAVDVGGTFTDLVLLNASTGELHVNKIPSTPVTPSDAVIAAVCEVCSTQDIAPSAISYFIHGTTMGINTLVEANGARTALVVSRGNRDLVEIGRQRVSEQFNLILEKPPTLVPRSHVWEIGARILASGDLLNGVSEAEIVELATKLHEEQLESCAICLVNSYANPAMETQVKELLHKYLPNLYVCCSAELWPEIREYERAMVALINAYVSPRVNDYFNSLLQGAESIGLSSCLYITKSNGGIMTVESAGQEPVQTLMSGPASGVIGASFIAGLIEIDEAITFDMGGTSSDISVIQNGLPLYSSENSVGAFPVIIPSIDVSSIGAGGGSIATVDDFGVLRVGPESAGADPGPACYGRGGTRPTITDAYLLIGHINPDNFLGGRIKLQKELAQAAIEPLARALSFTIQETAEAILRVATSNMSARLLPLLAKKGIDTRGCALLAYGGAGPTHACVLAEDVGLNQVVIPPSPGTLCALGALVTEVKRDSVHTLRRKLADIDPVGLSRQYEELATEAQDWLQREGPIVRGVRLVRSADMRYVGQPYDLEVTLGDAPQDLTIEYLRTRFNQAHQEVYKYSDPAAPIQITNIRLRIIGLRDRLVLPDMPMARPSSEPQSQGERELYQKGKMWKAKVYQRGHLGQGSIIDGPAVIEQEDTTTVVPLGFTARVRRFGIVVIERSSGNED